MTFTPAQFAALPPAMRGEIARAANDAPLLEIPLHNQIIQFCKDNRWLYLHARTDCKSTIALAAQDFTIFASRGRTFCIECKSRTGKLTLEQNAWRVAMECNGHTVHLVRSFTEFMEVVKCG